MNEYFVEGNPSGGGGFHVVGPEGARGSQISRAVADIFLTPHEAQSYADALNEWGPRRDLYDFLTPVSEAEMARRRTYQARPERLCVVPGCWRPTEGDFQRSCAAHTRLGQEALAHPPGLCSVCEAPARPGTSYCARHASAPAATTLPPSMDPYIALAAASAEYSRAIDAAQRQFEATVRRALDEGFTAGRGARGAAAEKTELERNWVARADAMRKRTGGPNE